MSNLLNAIRPLAWDFFPTIAFAALTAMHVDVQLATPAAVGAGVVQLIVMKATGREVGLLQWAGLGLALVFGTISFVTRDPRFIMAKPTLIYFAVAVVMLKRGWMLRYMPEIARHHGAPLMIRWGYAWAGLMALTGVANGVIALWFTKEWALFIAVVPIASKLTMFAIQYVSVRHIVRGKIIAEREAEARREAPAQAQAA
ncbi:inner membrane-spanning protein YciB [Phenylobacterium sp.]|uniref:inner membrane-spanning protein YciB n=1 Tax=Phenylobacterium sp. TaxID=1871053 RepID=UPI002DE80AB3|nr:septation protein IspZ [Phenylobacterium sp.]